MLIFRFIEPFPIRFNPYIHNCDNYKEDSLMYTKIIIIALVAIILLFLVAVYLTARDMRVAVLFMKDRNYTFKTGTFLHRFAIIHIKGCCSGTIRNSYSKEILRCFDVTGHKIYILNEKNKYNTLSIDKGEDFLVEIVYFMPRA